MTNPSPGAAAPFEKYGAAAIRPSFTGPKLQVRGDPIGIASIRRAIGTRERQTRI
jgi:hypothetical protein